MAHLPESQEHHAALMAQIGPEAWKSLHQWAQDFRAKVGNSCGCGDVAVAVTTAFHDRINQELGKPVRDGANLKKVGEFFQAAEMGRGVRYQRGSIESVVKAALRLKADVTLFVVPTYRGFSIEKRPPPGTESYYEVLPLGEVFRVKTEFDPQVRTGFRHVKERIHPDTGAVMGGPKAYVGNALEGDAWVEAAHGDTLHIIEEHQGPDPWGSRCRDAEGRWTEKGLCGPVPTDSCPAFPKEREKSIATSPDGVRQYEFVHKILDASQIIPSHNPFTFVVNEKYSQVLQPRLRDRAAAELQVKRIASQLSPEALLTDFHTLDRGAPIIGSDMLVESGNGRAMGVIRAKSEHPEIYAIYKEQLTQRAATFGLDAASISRLETPILVRLRVTKLSPTERIDFVREANVPAGISRSAIEQARTDAEKITLNMLSILEINENESIFDALRAVRNSEFVRTFLGGLPENERGQLVDAKGVINMDGIRRTAQAVFVSAFGAGEPGLRLGEMAFESIDQDVRNVFNALSRSIVTLAHSESLIRSGNRATELSISDDLANTIRVLTKIKNDPALTVAKYLDQSQLFERELTPFQEGMLRLLNDNIRSSKRLANIFRNYGDSVIAQPPPSQGGLFGPTDRPTKEELWSQAVANRDREPVPVAAFLGQIELPGIRANRIEWCNVSVDAQARVLGWRPLRNLLRSGQGYQARVEVCEAGFGGDQYQVTIGAFKGDRRLSSVQMEKLRSLAFSLKGAAKEVKSKDPGILVWEVTLPGPELKELSLTPMMPKEEKPRTRIDPRLQPALFQGQNGDHLMVYEQGTEEQTRINKRLFELFDEYYEIKAEREETAALIYAGRLTAEKGLAIIKKLGEREDRVFKEQASLVPSKKRRHQRRPGMSQKPVCTPAQRARLERCIREVKSRTNHEAANPWAVCTASIGCRRGSRMSSLVETILPTVAAGFAGTIGAIGASRLLTPKVLTAPTVVTSPEATIRVIDDRPHLRDTQTANVYNPKTVEGDQAEVDLGTLLEEIDQILKSPDRMGEVDTRTLRVVREGR